MWNRRILPVLYLLCATVGGQGQNYIRYHQRSLVEQEHMVGGRYDEALDLLNKLDKRYGLMPTETVARAICLASIGDTATAHRSYLRSVEQRSDLAWMSFAPPALRTALDSAWYGRVVNDCLARWDTMQHYANGPNPGIPTPTTELNRRHQAMVENPGDTETRTARYASLIAEHDALLKRFLNGELQVPSIAEYGINSEFETFIIHCSTELTTANEKAFKRWLKRGLVYPVFYATPFDDLANHRNEKFPYGIFSGLRPEDMLPGHAERRAAIGMGDERLERLRFNRPEWQP